MAIELLNSEHWSTLINTLNNSKKTIRIISPFIGFKTAQLLKQCVKDNKIKCILITRFYREDFLNNASSLEGLKELVSAGVEVYALQDLHTKLYLFDESVSIVGSANFTMGGFKLNHELSMIISDENEIINSLNKYFDDILNEINSTGNWLIDINKIEEEINKTDTIIKNRRDKSVKFSNNIKFGAKFNNSNNLNDNDIIENIITNESKMENDNEVWLKFEGTGDKRVEADSKYEVVRLGLDNKMVTCFPRRPRGIANNDYIYLAALSWDKNNVATPMIVARARTTGFNVDNIASDDEINSIEWLRDYPYYCDLIDIEAINAEIKECISLNTIIKEVGSNLYPGTIGKNVSVQEIRTRHYQKSHIKITSTAKTFIDYKFEELKSKYGLLNI